MLYGTIPSEIWNLTNLRELNLRQAGRQGQAFPHEVTNLTNLELLDLGLERAIGHAARRFSTLSRLKLLGPFRQ